MENLQIDNCVNNTQYNKVVQSTKQIEANRRQSSTEKSVSTDIGPVLCVTLMDSTERFVVIWPNI